MWAYRPRLETPVTQPAETRSAIEGSRMMNTRGGGATCPRRCRISIATGSASQRTAIGPRRSEEQHAQNEPDHPGPLRRESGRPPVPRPKQTLPLCLRLIDERDGLQNLIVHGAVAAKDVGRGVHLADDPAEKEPAGDQRPAIGGYEARRHQKKPRLLGRSGLQRRTPPMTGPADKRCEHHPRRHAHERIEHDRHRTQPQCGRQHTLQPGERP